MPTVPNPPPPPGSCKPPPPPAPMLPSESHAVLCAKIARLRAVRIDWAEAYREHNRLFEAHNDDILTGATASPSYPDFHSAVDAQLKAKLEACP